MVLFLVLAGVAILALVGLCLKVRGKSVLRLERFSLDDQEQDRALSVAPPPSIEDVGEVTTSPLSSPPPAHTETSPPTPGPSEISKAAPAPFAIWRVRPVFLTSTFQDFHADGDHVRGVVFPALEERLRPASTTWSPSTCAGGCRPPPWKRSTPRNSSSSQCASRKSSAAAPF
jgi:hypothetical protein